MIRFFFDQKYILHVVKELEMSGKVLNPYMMKMFHGMKSTEELQKIAEEEGNLHIPSLEEEYHSEEECSGEEDSEEEEENSEDEIEESQKEELQQEEKKEEVNEQIKISSVEFHSLQRIMMRTEMMMGEIFRKLDTISQRIENVEDRLTHIEECQKYSYAEFNGEIIKIKEIKSESYDISESEVIKALVYQDYRSFIYIFKSYYRSIQGGKIFYPIRMKNRRTFEYYYNGRWVLDPNGHFIIKTLCNNVQNLFMKYNVIENKLFVEDQWYHNQQFIMKLSDERYKKEILKHIIDEIMLAS